AGKYSSISEKLPCLLSTENQDDLYYIIQQQYGGVWGTFNFEDSFGDCSGESRPFLYVDGNIDLYVLSQFMAKEWKLEKPNLVVPILSAVSRYKIFKNLKMIEALKTGIRNVANASKTWYITNGFDLGLPQLIGYAFRDETLIRRADDAWAIKTGRDPKKRKTLVLIGIVCDDEIQGLIDFKAAQEEPKKNVKVRMHKRDQILLNSEHTHFIIIREQSLGSGSTYELSKQNITTDNGGKQLEKITDAANSVTNTFRDRFENFLHQQKAPEQNITSRGSRLPITINSAASTSNKTYPYGEDDFPMVCVLARGTPVTIERVLRRIQNEIPILILKGVGSTTDIIAFAYEEISAKIEKEHDDNYLKVELARRILDDYPLLRNNNVKRNEIRDCILSIVSLVKKKEEENRKLLTFVDINNATASLDDFHKFILLALFQSQKVASGGKLTVQLKQNLSLTLDWNLPDLALSEIFQRDDNMKYTIQASLFDEAILGKKLESFVDLFLDRDFVLHRYLTSDKLIELLNKAKDKEFFTTTSIEGILGETGDEDNVEKEFVEQGLNAIVNRLTDINHFFSKYEMDCNAMGIYFCDKSDMNVQRQRIRAEKKALRRLIIYAVLMNRHQLAKILWKRSSEPITLALLCYMMFNKLAPYCHESYQRKLIEKQAKEFSDCALGVLDKAFNEDNMRAFEMLDEKHADWNNMATIELAYSSDNKAFVAHAACQKWVTRQFYGEITPRELTWGLFKCSDSLKIISSAILIFPMWFWINFSPIGQAPPSPKKTTDLSSNENKGSGSGSNVNETTILPRKADKVNIREGNGLLQRLKRCFGGGKSKKQKPTPNASDPDEKDMSHFEEIHVLWSAPITKFYTNFVAYIIFLLFFTLAVMWPSCGNLILDCIVWIFAASIAFEKARVTYEKYCSQSSLPFHRAVLEVIVEIIFLALYLGVRIIGLWNFGTCHILPAKAILGIGLIYYYYRLLIIFSPISPKLGPMMIRLRHMIIDDFLTFLQLFVIFMISSGVAITAVLYPHHPLNLDLFTRAFVFRGLMALFSGDMSDLKKQENPCTLNATTSTEKAYACLRLSQGLSFSYDNLKVYQRYGIPTPICNQTSWIAWVLIIQYFFLAQRFLASLLTAMFGLTGARVQSQSEQIWMYNRYEIVLEYAKRPCLPPPFVLISYIIMLIQSCSHKCTQKAKEYSDKKKSAARRKRAVSSGTDKNHYGQYKSSTIDLSTAALEDHSLVGHSLDCKSVTEKEDKKNKNASRNTEDSEANLYWKYKAQEYYAKTQEGDKVQEKLDSLSNCVTNIQKDIDLQRKSLRQINDRAGTLDRLLIDSHVLLEKIQSTIQRGDKALSEVDKFTYILSRESPYIYTNEPRFPVTERYISWKIQFGLYDPVIITLPKEHACFKESERPFVEPELLKSTSDDSRTATTGEYEENLLTIDNSITVPINQPDLFGAIEAPITPVTNNITIPFTDFKWNQISELQLPNGKKIIVDRTTWIANSEDRTSSVYQLDAQLSKPLNPIGRTGVRGRGALIRWGPNKSILAVITRWKTYHGQFTIIDGQRILEALVFKDKTSNDWRLPGGKVLGVESPYGVVCLSFNKLAFKHFDSEYSLSTQEEDMIEYFKSFARPSSSTAEPTGFNYRMVYQGYIDDLRNTDNAWAEAEIWNFHYDSDTPFPNLRTDDVAVWKDVTNNSRAFLIQPAILREIARIHDAYFE
ncbi:unnamed protein product, partial [Rotaria socialis]